MKFLIEICLQNNFKFVKYRIMLKSNLNII